MADKLKGGIIGGSTDLSVPVILRQTTDNKELKGLTDANILASYWRQGGIRVSITLTSLAAANSAHADGGWIEVDSAAMPGVYRLDLPDAAIASAADWVVLSAISTTTSSYLWVQEYTITGDPASSIGFAVINVATASLIAAVATLSGTMNALAASLALTAFDPLTKTQGNALAASLALTAYDPPTKAEMDAVAASLALTAYDPPTNTELTAGLGALNDITVAEVWAQVIDTLAAPAVTMHADDALLWCIAYISGNIAKASTTFSYADGAGSALWSNDVQPTTRTRS